MKVSLSIALLFTTASLAAEQSLYRRCGFKFAPCRAGTHCIPNSKDCTNLDLCAGHCVSNDTFDICGGWPELAKRCSAGYRCIQDPRDPPGIMDKPGICLLDGFKGLRMCGGITNHPCQEPEQCYDLPHDGCDPYKGDTYCQGICL